MPRQHFETCHTCQGDGRVEVCTECSNDVENCTCQTEYVPVSTEETCTTCDGDGAVETD